eukprot:7719751-Pyramimonas_sp.AAC.1
MVETSSTGYFPGISESSSCRGTRPTYILALSLLVPQAPARQGWGCVRVPLHPSVFGGAPLEERQHGSPRPLHPYRASLLLGLT